MILCLIYFAGALLAFTILNRDSNIVPESSDLSQIIFMSLIWPLMAPMALVLAVDFLLKKFVSWLITR